MRRALASLTALFSSRIRAGASALRLAAFSTRRSCALIAAWTRDSAMFAPMATLPQLFAAPSEASLIRRSQSTQMCLLRLKKLAADLPGGGKLSVPS